MLRIAFDTSTVRGLKTGIGVYTAHLMRAINDYAPEIETISLQDDAGVVQRTDKRIYREQFILPHLAQQAGADLMHLTGFASPLRSRVPVILTVMDLIGVLFAYNFPPVSRLYWSRYLPTTLRAPQHLLTLSEHTKRDVIKLAGIAPARITVIPPGVDERFRMISDVSVLQEVQARLDLPSKFFLFVSTIEPRKGVDTLLTAYAKIAGELEEHLVVVGKRGWYAGRLIRQAQELNLANRVRWTDYVANADLPAIYNLATAFVFPSRYEGFGLTPLEAMASGAPVISSNAASLPEVVGDAGILLPLDDTDGFARAMNELATNPTRRASLRELGINRAQQFSWQRAARDTVQSYKSLLANL